MALENAKEWAAAQAQADALRADTVELIATIEQLKKGIVERYGNLVKLANRSGMAPMLGILPDAAKAEVTETLGGLQTSYSEVTGETMQELALEPVPPAPVEPIEPVKPE